jgi:hypothetical protein
MVQFTVLATAVVTGYFLGVADERKKIEMESEMWACQYLERAPASQLVSEPLLESSDSEPEPDTQIKKPKKKRRAT